MKVAVTGATGHLGANLVRRLLDAGHQVNALVRGDTRALENLDLHRFQGDILEGESIDPAIHGAEIVYHLAAHISILPEWDLLHRVNTQGTANVVAACLRCRIKRLVHVSSVEALIARAGAHDQVINERQPPEVAQLKNAYGRSKAMGVEAVRRGIEQGLDAVIVNPSAIIGPHDYKPSHFGQVIIDLARGSMLALVQGGFDLVDVRDVAAGLTAAAEKGQRGESYLLTGRFVELSELADHVARLTGRRKPRTVLPIWLAGCAGAFTPPYYRLTGKRPRFTRMSVALVGARYQFSHDKASRQLGYAPRPFEDTIEETLAWLRGQGCIP